MEIILLQDIDKVGDKHTIVTVRNGYGRNYLIPQGLAIVANATNRNMLEDLKRREATVESRRLSEYQAIADKLQGAVLKIGAKVGTSGKIFGSVTNVQLANALKEQYEVEIERRKISIPEEVKMLGAYKAILALHKEVHVEIDFEVIAE
ncbi:MAG: 50S ribosomal protein L9 [Saprospiraceae bacterium]|nr:50S ribosomal protein L9 [Saprospiraceae bacterium]NUQ25163.1 50S ribosomal protein L9 [Saprospiraceae bacterium]